MSHLHLKPNLLIHDDALEVSERMADETIDLVYLDPPWLTNKNIDEKAKEDYKTFMYKVFQQSKRLLKETGNLFLYSRPDINLDFQSLLLDVFGTEGFVTEFIIPAKRKNSLVFWTSHETLLFYSKTPNHTYNKVYSVNEKDIAFLFPYKDAKGRFTFFSLFGRLNSKSKMLFKWKGTTPPDNYQWRFSKETLDEMEEHGLIVSHNDKLYQKKYLTSEDQLLPISTIWNDITTRLKGEFLGEQSVAVLERVLKIGTNADELMFDPFCGSGTSVEACIKTNRKFIAVDNDKTAIETTQARLIRNQEVVEYNYIDDALVKSIEVVWNKYKQKHLSIEDEIYDMILRGENDTIEFKASTCWNFRMNKEDPNLIKPVLSTIASFLNTNGGTILVGVNDDKSLFDLKIEYTIANKQKANQDGYELYLNNKIRGCLGSDVIGKYSLGIYIINDMTVCKIDVLASMTPVFCDGDFYVRNNNESVKLNAKDAYNFLSGKRLSS